MKKIAFTLAEVLITITIIGIVAVLLLPPFIEDMSERIDSEKQANLVFKITQATNKMMALGELTPFSDTDSFVDVLQKHIKVLKRCDSEHLKDCWPTEKVKTATGEELKIEDIKTGVRLGFKNRTTKNVGLVLADGSSLILTYDPDFAGVSNTSMIIATSADLPVGSGKTKKYRNYSSNTTGGLSFIADVNGNGSPNREYSVEKNGDIRSFNNAKLSSGCDTYYDKRCIVFLDSYSSISCVTDKYNKYCIDEFGHKSGSSTDYWAGARKACDDLGEFELPDNVTLRELNGNVGRRLDYYLSSTVTEAGKCSYVNSNGGISTDCSKSGSGRRVLCIK